MATEKPTKAKLEGKVVRLVWSSADDLPAIYSNHLLVTHGSASEFHIIFGHLTPPLLVTESPDDIPDTLTVKSVVKIVVTYKTMKKFVEVMSNNLSKFEDKEKEVENAG